MTPDELMRQAHLKDDVERLQRELATAHDCWRSDVAEMRAELALARAPFDDNVRLAEKLQTARGRLAELEAVLTAARRLAVVLRDHLEQRLEGARERLREATVAVERHGQAAYVRREAAEVMPMLRENVGFREEELWDIEQLVADFNAFDGAVRAADATPPTERAESHADAPNPRDQGQNP